MEACYDILQLPITEPSVKKEFIMTGKPDEWVFITEDKLQELNTCSEDV